MTLERTDGPDVGAAGFSGRPGRSGVAGWVWDGVQRQGLAFVAALLICWGGLAAMIAAAFVFAVVGGLVGFFGVAIARALQGGAFSDFLPDWIFALSTTAQFGAVIAGFVGGLVAGPAAVLSMIVGESVAAGSVLTYVGRLLPGLVLGLLLLLGLIVFEPWVLRLRGARRMSRREAERVDGIAGGVLRAYDLREGPDVLVNDAPEQNAEAWTRHVVIYRGMWESLDDDELAGVLAHELHHWRAGDAIGSNFVYSCAAPVLLIYEGAWRVASLHPVLALIVWFFAWPIWVSVRFVLVPVLALSSRRQEYEADRAAVRAGFGEGLYRALEQVRDIEAGGSGWSRTVAATHPPTELRLEAIEDAMRDREGDDG